MALLAEGQTEVADAFAGRLRPPERFGVGEWGEWPSGQPLLRGA